MNKQSAALFSAATVLIAVWGACGHDQPAKGPDNPAPPPTTAAAEPAGADAGENTAATAAAQSAPTPAAESATVPPTTGAGAGAAESTSGLTDDEIVLVLHTANRGEIDQGNLAQTKAKDARVKKLAAMMVKDHTAADTKGVALAKKVKLQPAPSSVASSLQSDAESTTTSLKSETGGAFDKAYVDAQVKEHQAVLDTIDQKLLPNVKNAELKAFITEVRPKIAMHLQHAQDLQKSLEK
ncbi:MAG: DUF4142 domain-containing protein [Myxococcales bacterium]|nr:DUF4142 domain-containing protein [Myxococcales bacterium]